MTRRFSLSSIVALAALATGATACSSSPSTSPSSDTPATASVDSNSAETSTALVGATVAGAGTELAPPGATNPGNVYQPAGCITATANAASKTVTYVFNGCTGPWGLLALNGTVTVVWSVPSTSKLQLQFSASGFKVDNATVDWMATAVITANGSARDMTWTGSLNGTTAGGRAFTRTNNKDLKWNVGQPCISLAGSSDGTIAGAHLVTTVSNYQQCAGSCPAMGGDISVQDMDDGQSWDVKFNGSADAQATGPNGGQVSVPLECGG
jgi:hypothetical protein